MTNPPDSHYRKKFKSIVKVFQNSSLRVSQVAEYGSRARRQHRPDSDLDIIFSVSGNPSPEDFYPNLMEVLRGNFPADTIYPGSDYNIVHQDTSKGGRIEHVLLPESQFNRQYRALKDYKRNNL